MEIKTMKQGNLNSSNIVANTARGRSMLMVDRYLNGKPSHQNYDNPNLKIGSLKKTDLKN